MTRCAGETALKGSIAMVNAVVSALPFSSKHQRVCVPEGLSLAQMVDGFTLTYGNSVDAVVMFEENIVPKHRWKYVKPKENAHIVINVIPQGGGGKKNPLSAILSIAIMVAAPYIASTYATSLGLAVTGTVGPLTAGQVAFYNAAIRVGLGAVGFLATSMLASTPKQTASTPDPTESPTQFIEGATNTLNPYGVVPICLGKNRMVPPQAARSYTETAGGKQYVRQLFTYGYSQNLVVRNQKIGESPLSAFTGVNQESRLAGNLDSGTTLYPQDTFQDNYSILLNEADSWTVRTTQVNVDEASVDFTFPNGLTQYSDEGNRGLLTVALDLQFAPAGTGNWSAGSGSFTSIGSQSTTVAAAPLTGSYVTVGGITYEQASYQLVVSINPTNGQATYTRQAGIVPAAIPDGNIRIGSATVTTRRQFGSTTISTNTTITDDRQSTLFGNQFQNTSSFVPSAVGTTINISAGGLRFNTMSYTAAQGEALRITQNVRFPTRGQYDIRVRRTTPDTNDQKIIDKVYLTAIRSITYGQPVLLDGITGTAVRIQATDQLNGQIEQYNAEVSNIILDYKADAGTWIASETSNPASIYRYVLQSDAFDFALDDSQIDLPAIEEWHTYCQENGLTYDRVIDYETSMDDILRDIAAAGFATPNTSDGLYSVVVDYPKDDIVQMVTPRNSWNYSGAINYPLLPHAFRVEFRNRDAGYIQDERIVYSDGYDETNATRYERLQFLSCTNSDLAWKYGRRYLANLILQPEVHTFYMDVENLVATRGDRIKFVNDVILVGVGQGRVKQVDYDSNGDIIGFTIDDTVSIPSANNFGARIRHSDNSYTYVRLITVVGETQSFQLAMPLEVDSSTLDWQGDLVSFVEDGQELDLIITAIVPQADLSAQITAVDYAPARFTADQGEIPPWQSNVTLPLEFIAPVPPVLGGTITSDETVMLRNSDGSYTGRMIIPLENNNGPEVVPNVLVRLTGSNVYTRANILEATADMVVLTGLEDGSRYDFAIRYQRPNSNVISQPLLLNSILYVGASGIPSDVTGFVITVTGENGLLEWNKNPEIDIDHYEIRYSRATSGVTWSTAQPLENLVYENRITLPYQIGTYLIKAVDILGNESATATAIVTVDGGALRNVVELLEEDPDFLGTKVNTSVIAGMGLILDDPATDGYYYFDNNIDLSEVYTSFVSSEILAYATFLNDIFAMDDIFQVQDLMGGGNNDMFAMADIFNEEDIFGIGLNAWLIRLEWRRTDDDPLVSPTWTAWEPFTAGAATFRAAEFRLYMDSEDDNVTPVVTRLAVLVDMPDRIERGEDLTVTAAGVTITYPYMFKNNPAVNITTQDGAVDDRIEYSYKQRDGFTFRVYNATAAGYVTRSFDYIASGYGRVLV